MGQDLHAGRCSHAARGIPEPPPSDVGKQRAKMAPDAERRQVSFQIVLYLPNAWSPDPASSVCAHPAPWEVQSDSPVAPDFQVEKPKPGEVK